MHFTDRTPHYRSEEGISHTRTAIAKGRTQQDCKMLNEKKKLTASQKELLVYIYVFHSRGFWGSKVDIQRRLGQLLPSRITKKQIWLDHWANEHYAPIILTKYTLALWNESFDGD